MRTTAIVGILLIAAGAGAAAQDQLRTAKDLYASAAYEDALAALSRMETSADAPEITREVDQYRAFSLYALGRTREAESVAEAMVRRDPLARLDSVDASPRLEKMYTDVRKRLLPALIREKFKFARSALDAKNFEIAKPLLTDARLMIGESEKLELKDEGLGDLTTLIDGFLQLIRFESEKLTAAAAVPAPVPDPGPAAGRAAAGPPVSPPVSPTAPPPANRGAAPAATAPAPRPPAASPAAQSPVPASGAGPRVYSIDDEGVLPPVAVDQRLPAMSAAMGAVIKGLHSNGLFDILIDETGRVLEATVRKSLNASFDALVIRSARSWKYQPATKDGVPVRYLKTLLLVP
ncbi:MAG: energy transducer TonB [Acidobacteriota bacterium]